MPQTGTCLPAHLSPCLSPAPPAPLLCPQVVDFFNGNLKRRRQKQKEATTMMKLKRLSSVHTEANGAVIGLSAQEVPWDI